MSITYTCTLYEYTCDILFTRASGTTMFQYGFGTEFQYLIKNKIGNTNKKLHEQCETKQRQKYFKKVLKTYRRNCAVGKFGQVY